VRDSSDGTTVLLDWQSGTVKAGSQMQVGILWVPHRAGEYELRAFAITDFDSPEILSQISSSEVTIASARSSYPVMIGNRSFDVGYSFSSTEGTVQSMKMLESGSAIIANVDVERDTNLAMAFPIKLLEQMEIASEYHYCVGNALDAFVNEVPVDSEFGDAIDAYVLTIPLKTGSNTLEIIGEDLLQSPTNCFYVGLEEYSFVRNDPSVKVYTLDQAVKIARDHLDNLAQSNGEEEGANRGGPVGSVDLVYLHENGKAFLMNRYGGIPEGVYPNFNHTPTDSSYWIVTLNRAQDPEEPEYTFTIDAQTGEVKELVAT
jgi:hypothetical protein